MPTFLVILFAVALTVMILPAQTVQAANVPDDPLATLRPSHPRLIATADDFERIAAEVNKGGAVAEWYAGVKNQADATLDSALPEYELPDGVRLLSVSRRLMGRAYVLGLAYQIESARGNDATQYRDALWANLQAVCNFKDWNPSHFLDTAEMAHGVAIGLDWLWNDWTPEQRDLMIDAIDRLALQPGLEAYDADVWWTKTEFNWNQVCNGGLSIGALAIADERPETARKILKEAIERLPVAINEYGRDGAWEEGLGYWGYATNYTIYGLASLQSALGTDFGLSDSDRLAKAWQFPKYLVGPTGRSFNFADSGDGAGGTPALWWLAERYDTPAAVEIQRPRADRRPRPLDVIWGSKHSPADVSDIPLSLQFRDGGILTMRSAWDDSDAAWVAIKAGRNGANHGQLDLGTFVYEVDGERWFVDLGGDSYSLPGYFDSNVEGGRWTYYRNRAEGHNTIVVNPGKGPDQPIDARVSVESFEDGKATVDYSAAAGVPWQRTVLLDDKTLHVRDELRTDEAAQVWWFAHTEAEVELSEDGRTATLRQEGKTLRVQLDLPADARFEVMDPRPLPTSPPGEGQNANEGIHKLAIHLPEASGETVIEVTASPVE